MADSNLTFRMPEELKTRLVTACERAHQTQSDFILAALSQRLDGACSACGRDAGALVTQPPGMTDAFAAWIRELVPTGASESGPVAIATQEPNGPRVYFGSFKGDGVFPSFLYLRPEERGKPYLFDRIPIARAYVTMWGHYQPADLLRTRLRNGGYFDVTAALFNSAPVAPSAERPPRTRRTKA
jgi:hypothetical protein